ncbi:MAG: (2Fe-2S) ferredoxin domain-containing protein [Alphaproteobacteria bacterium]|nr:(2Fe-2S) ferredoxin domain-containing protein [Alphaproteobacteria bacterium]MBQ8347664.1 (2Fe-2S) ferredoxin domain-containing protein [Alphaproteobacteria bacterium]
MPENGKITITVCMGSSCFARGNAENLSFIENFVKEKGLDAKIDLCGSRCENKCATGPHVKINGTMYSGVTPEMLKAVLSKAAEE